MNEAENINDMKDAEEMKEKEIKIPGRIKPPCEACCLLTKEVCASGHIPFVLTVIVIAAAINTQRNCRCNQIRGNL